MSVNFKQVQIDFAAHIRNPENHTGPGEIEARRLKIYSELFYNNVENFVSRAFPVVKKIYSEKNWHAMVRDFFEHHTCHSPYFSDISKEFLSFLQNERDSSKYPEDPPFLAELAHYEWTELVLEISQEEIPNTGFNSNGKMLHSQIVISPLVWVLHYRWPVHLIGPGFQPSDSDRPYFLVVYRNKADNIKFMEVSAINARLLGIIQDNPSFTGTHAIEVLSKELTAQGINNLSLDFLLEKGEESLIHLRDQGVLLGTRIKSIE